MLRELIQTPRDLFRLVRDTNSDGFLALTVMAVVSWAANMIDLTITDKYPSASKKKARSTSSAE